MDRIQSRFGGFFLLVCSLLDPIRTLFVDLGKPAVDGSLIFLRFDPDKLGHTFPNIPYFFLQARYNLPVIIAGRERRIPHFCPLNSVFACRVEELSHGIFAFFPLYYYTCIHYMGAFFVEYLNYFIPVLDLLVPNSWGLDHCTQSWPLVD